MALGQLRIVQGSDREAEQTSQMAVARLEGGVAHDHPLHLYALARSCWLEGVLGAYTRAEAPCRSVLDNPPATPGSDVAAATATANALNDLGSIYTLMGGAAFDGELAPLTARAGLSPGCGAADRERSLPRLRGSHVRTSGRPGGRCGERCAQPGRHAAARPRRK